MGNTVERSLRYVPTENIPEDNGIRFLGKLVPHEILCHILTFVPGKDLVLSGTRVCKYWNDLLSDNHFWLTKLQFEGVMLSETARARIRNEENAEKVLHVLRALSSLHLPLNRNLIKNPSGEDGLANWKIRHGGDGLRVESSPSGSDPIPEEAQLPTQNCFATSYGRCVRQQVVDLQQFGFTDTVMDMLQPEIVISEWVSARFDCRSESFLKVDFYGRLTQSSVDLKWSSDDDGMINTKWYEVKKVVSDYPEGLHKIEYINTGKDRQFWAGYYGAKTAGSSIKIVL